LSNYFVWIIETEPFQLFSISHLSALFVLVMIFLGFVLLTRKKSISEKQDKFLRIFLGSAMIVQEISLNIFRVQTGIWSLAESLPFHLCSFSIILGSLLYFTKSKFLFDILYYWAAGALVALFTPDLTTTDFPAFRYYQFFLSHGLIVFSVIYFMSIHHYKPGNGSLKRTLIFTHALVPFIAIINYLTGGNYFFIAYTPKTASPIDLLGPWPYYLIGLEIILVSVFSMMYLPFYIKSKKSRMPN